MNPINRIPGHYFKVAKLFINNKRLLNLHDHSKNLLQGDKRAGRQLTKMSVLWQITRCDPSTWKIKIEPKKLIEQLEDFLGDRDKAGIAFMIIYHLAYNAEHIAPLPVLTTFLHIGGELLIQARDLGRGLGKYMDYVGGSHSTRPFKRQMQFGMDDQGNGIMLTLNQVLNGCQGRAVIESSGQIILLEREGDRIAGKRIFGSKLAGTRFLFYLPLENEWVKKDSGWDPYSVPGSLDITFQRSKLIELWHGFLVG